MDSTVYYDPSVTATLQSVFGLVVPEAILVAAACVLFIGSTVRGSRNLWAIAALVAIGVAVAAMAFDPASTMNPIRP